MFAIIYFVRVCRDKHIKATEKIQAQMLEPFFFCSLCSNGNLCSFIIFKCIRLYFTDIHAKTVMGTGLCRSGQAKVQSRLTL